MGTAKRRRRVSACRRRHSDARTKGAPEGEFSRYGCSIRPKPQAACSGCGSTGTPGCMSAHLTPLRWPKTRSAKARSDAYLAAQPCHDKRLSNRARMRIFNIPASAPFLAHAHQRAGGRPPDRRLRRATTPRAALGDATLYLPTRRACRMARDTFLEVLQREAVLLPRIVAIGDIDEDELAFATAAQPDALDLPPPLEPLRRRLMLARLIASWAERVKPKDPDDPLLVVTRPASPRSTSLTFGAADGRHGDAAGAVGRARQAGADRCR